MDFTALLDEIRTIARNGLTFSENPYDRERYQRLLDVAVRKYSEILQAPEGLVRERLLKELGYITPKVGTDAAIFNGDGHILLMDRSDGSGWCLPCGWVEPNESPAQAIIREVFEETGLHARVRQLVGVFSRPADSGYGPHSMIAVVHLCDVLSGELTLSHEGLDLRYWPLDEVPRWHATHEHYARSADQCRLSNGNWQALSE
jgi:ADP-ribose pyrophosphatase YjhB (NUDIX family)